MINATDANVEAMAKAVVEANTICEANASISLKDACTKACTKIHGSAVFEPAVFAMLLQDCEHAVDWAHWVLENVD